MIVTTKLCIFFLTLQHFTNITLIVHSHPGASGEPGLLGLDGSKEERGQPGVPELPGLEVVCGPPVTAIQIFLKI